MDHRPAELLARRPARLSRRWLASAAAAIVALATAFHVLRAAAPDRLSWPVTGTATLTVAGVAHRGPGADRIVPIASVAKVMTARVILQDHPLRDGDDGPAITVSSDGAAAYAGQRARGESLVKVEGHEPLTERQALEALLLPSADNMAWILARWDAGSQTRFVQRMNDEATRLGMHHTSYTDASGLAAETVSTASDQVVLAVAALRVPMLATIAAALAASDRLVVAVRS